MINREEFIKTIAPMLKTAGFRKKGSTWRKEYEETIGVFNVQGSQWGPEYYLNTAMYVKSLGDEQTPLERDCHLRSRIEKANKSTDVLFKEVCAWLEANSTAPGMRMTIVENPFIPATVNLKRHLNLA